MAKRVLLGWVIALFAMTPAFAQTEFERGYDEAVATAKAAMMGDPAAALDAAQRAETSAVEAEEIAAALWLQGEALTRMNRAKAARPILERASSLLGETGVSSPLAGDLAIAKGRAAKDVGDVQVSLVSYQTAFEVFHDLGDARGQAKALQYLGGLYIEAHQYDRALDYFRRADEVYDADPSLALASANSQANALRELGRHEQSISLFNDALSVSESFNSPVLRARILTNRAASEVRADQIEAAAASTDEALSLIEAAGADDWAPFIWGVKAEAALADGDLDAAAGFVERAFADKDLTTTVGPFRDFHAAAYRIYAARGDDTRALAHHEAFKRLDDEGRALAASASAALLGAEFDFATQAYEIERLKTAQLERDVAFAAAKSRQRTLLFAGAIVLFVGITVSLAAAYVSIRRSRNEVRAAASELTDANVALERANRAKSDFLAMTSHEVRTPLNAIIGLTDVLLKSDRHDADALDNLQSIRSAGEAMAAIVDDLLDVAKIETGGLAIEPGPANLARVITDAVALLQPAAAAKGLAIDATIGEGLDDVATDAKRFRQIVVNLLSNAVKFTDEGGVTLTASILGEGEARRLSLSVRDTGVGVPADQLNRIFESFHQVDSSTSRRHGGVGLGLAICRNLARALGGDISVESRLGEGSTFTVDIAAPRSDAASKAGGSSSGAEVCLIVLANPIEAAIVRAVATSAGFEVEVAVGAKALADRAGATNIGVVVADAEAAQKWSPAPGQRGLILTQADDAVAPREQVRVLARPVSPATLAEAFRAAGPCSAQAA